MDSISWRAAEIALETSEIPIIDDAIFILNCRGRKQLQSVSHSSEVKSNFKRGFNDWLLDKPLLHLLRINDRRLFNHVRGGTREVFTGDDVP